VLFPLQYKLILKLLYFKVLVFHNRAILLFDFLFDFLHLVRGTAVQFRLESFFLQLEPQSVREQLFLLQKFPQKLYVCLKLFHLRC
jgi:hypothetical protein